MGDSSAAKGDYTLIEVNRLIYVNAVDFVPGVPPYTCAIVVEMSPTSTDGTRLIITNDVMHDDSGRRWQRWAGRSRLANGKTAGVRSTAWLGRVSPDNS